MAKCLNQRSDHFRCGYREPFGSPVAIPSPAPKLQIVNFLMKSLKSSSKLIQRNVGIGWNLINTSSRGCWRRWSTFHLDIRLPTDESEKQMFYQINESIWTLCLIRPTGGSQVAPFSQFPFNRIDTSYVEPFPIKKSSIFRRWLSEKLLKRLNMQMTALECYRGGQRSRHEISAAASFFQKKFFQSHRWRVIFIILSVQLCAEQQNCSSCNWKNEQTNEVFSWKASSLGSASSISRKSVWDDSLLILRK